MFWGVATKPTKHGCGLDPYQWRKLFPPITYPLTKQCLCGTRMTFESTPEYCSKCQTHTHPVYIRSIESLYRDQIVKDVHNKHQPINLLP